MAGQCFSLAPWKTLYGLLVSTGSPVICTFNPSYVWLVFPLGRLPRAGAHHRCAALGL